MKVIDINTWNRSQHFNHFKTFADPYFAVTLSFDVSVAYQFSKTNKISFFAKYLHDCMKAINAVENLRYRIIDNETIEFETIHASATIMREDKTFGFSFIEFDEDLSIFINHFEKERDRILNSSDLFPPRNGQDCIHCSVMPWFNFQGHKEPVSGKMDSVPKLAFSKVEQNRMNVAISANHALVDGYHIGLFAEKFQFNLNN